MRGNTIITRETRARTHSTLAAKLLIAAMVFAGPAVFAADDQKLVAGVKQSLSLSSLEQSLEPLKQRFNEHRGTRRFVAVLSPT